MKHEYQPLKYWFGWFYWMVHSTLKKEKQKGGQWKGPAN